MSQLAHRMFFPRMYISPESANSGRFRQRKNVDFPEPDGPMITTTSPGPTSRETLLSACNWCGIQKYLSTLRARIMGVSFLDGPSGCGMV